MILTRRCNTDGRCRSQKWEGMGETESVIQYEFQRRSPETFIWMAEDFN